jgi:hypothetical protein
MEQRDAKDAEFRNSLRWFFGIIATMGAAGLGMLARALNFY